MRALCLFCFDNLSNLGSTVVVKATRKLCVASSLFLVLVFMWVIPENPASHRYVEENGRRIFIALCAKHVILVLEVNPKFGYRHCFKFRL